MTAKNVRPKAKSGKGKSHTIGKVSIRKKGRYWYARYRAYRGAPTSEISLGVTIYEVARDKASALSRSLETGQGVHLDGPRVGERPTFKDLVALFDRTDRRWSESTRQGNAARLRLVREALDDVPLEGLTSHLLSRWLNGRLDAGQMGHASYNRYLSLLRRIFQAGVEHGWLQANPVESIRRMREDPKVPKALTEDEVERLLAECSPAVHDMVVMAAFSGLRRGEIWNLEWSDVDFDMGEVTVRKSKPGDWRMVPVQTRVQTMLRRRKDAGLPRPFAKSDGKKGLAAAARRAGLNEKYGHVHLHMLRHTYATILLDRGVGLETIQTALGHKTLSITRRYAKTRPERLREAIKLMEKPRHANT